MKPVSDTAHNGNRRDFLKKSTAALTGLGSITAAPFIYSKKQFRLVVIGTHAALQEEIRLKAMDDLGIEIVHEPAGNAVTMHRAATRPASFDLYEDSTDGVKILWQAGSIQPIEIERIRHWDSINSLTKTGKLTPDASYGAGDAPYTLLWAQKNRDLKPTPSDYVSFVPTFHNVDSFGYNADVIPEGIAYETESWAWLLDERFAGRVAVINAPTIAIFDLAMAAEAKGLINISNIGNMTRWDLDRLFTILIEYKKNGHFRGAWTSVPQSIDFMMNEGVIVQSMFSPAATALRGQGLPCIYAAPREGYRAWHGGICVSSKTHGPELDAAYEYIDWWLSGWAGAYISRQGFYISNPQHSKKYMTQNEWDYWYMGEQATEDLTNTQGQTAVKKGHYRKGGSYTNRLNNINVWNSAMDTYEYSLLKWQEFLLA